MVNYSHAEALGTRVDFVIPNTKLLDIMDTGQAEYNCHLEIANRVVISNRSPIRKGNAIIGAVGIFQDVFDFEAISQQLDSVNSGFSDWHQNCFLNGFAVLSKIFWILPIICMIQKGLTPLRIHNGLPECLTNRSPRQWFRGVFHGNSIN